MRDAIRIRKITIEMSASQRGLANTFNYLGKVAIRLEVATLIGVFLGKALAGYVEATRNTRTSHVYRQRGCSLEHCARYSTVYCSVHVYDIYT